MQKSPSCHVADIFLPDFCHFCGSGVGRSAAPQPAGHYFHFPDGQRIRLRRGVANGFSTISVLGAGNSQERLEVASFATWTLLEAANPGSVDPAPFVADERRLHVQALQYWQSRAQGRAMPRLCDCAGIESATFASRMVLVSLGGHRGTGHISMIGSSLEADVRPGRTANRRVLEDLLDRLALVVEKKRPILFEADAPLLASADADYATRGILLPLSDNKCDVTHVIAVIGWRRGDADAASDDPWAGITGRPINQ